MVNTVSLVPVRALVISSGSSIVPYTVIISSVSSFGDFDALLSKIIYSLSAYMP